VHRTQIQIDDRTYEALRRQAFERSTSLAQLVREALAQYLGEPPDAKRPWTLADFPWIGIGKSGLTDVSDRHDDYLADAFRS
jgi:hypothetical protein